MDLKSTIRRIQAGPEAESGWTQPTADLCPPTRVAQLGRGAGKIL